MENLKERSDIMSNYLVCLSDGHGMGTAGKRTPTLPDGITSETGNFMHENEFNRAVINKLDTKLKRCGFSTLLVAPTDEDTPLIDRSNLANAMKADAYVAVHANAFDSAFNDNDPQGLEVYHYPNSVNGNRLATIVHKYLMQGTSQTDRGVKSANFHEVREPNAVSILVEAGFMDNLYEAKLLLSDSFREECATEITKGLCEYFGVPYVEAQTPAPETQPTLNNLYRVRLSWDDVKSQQGAYRVLEGAIECANANAGYKVYDWNGVQVYPAPVVQAPVEHMYRVRKSWEDVKSQLSANKVLDNAKQVADEHASEGYRVFDENGVVVYTPSITPTSPVEPEKPPVVETPTPEPTPQPEAPKVSIMGKAEATPEQMAQMLLSKNPSPSIGITAYKFCELFLAEGAQEGVKGDIAFCQAMHETGWLKFGGQVLPEQHNYAGIGATNNSPVGKGAWFKDEQEGIRAQIQHLKAYASKDALVLDCVDPRFNLVTRGIAPAWTDLNGRWAVPGTTYGQSILTLFDALAKIVVEDKPPVEEKPPVVTPPVEEKPPVEPPKEEAIITDEEAKSIIELLLELVVKLISYFKKK